MVIKPLPFYEKYLKEKHDIVAFLFFTPLKMDSSSILSYLVYWNKRIHHDQEIYFQIKKTCDLESKLSDIFLKTIEIFSRTIHV